jgi:predicted membrane chloride channel (bestrophin family)
MLAAAGECDAIARTPTPFEFAAHTSRFLTLFCFTLPLVLAPQMGWPAVPACTLVAYSLLAIDEMSAVIEAPFAGYLPLKEMFAALRGDVLEFIEGASAGAAEVAGAKAVSSKARVRRERCALAGALLRRARARCK